MIAKKKNYRRSIVVCYFIEEYVNDVNEKSIQGGTLFSKNSRRHSIMEFIEDTCVTGHLMSS